MVGIDARCLQGLVHSMDARRAAPGCRPLRLTRVLEDQGVDFDSKGTGGFSWVSAFFSLNLLLFVFNLLPFFPLDGSAAITLLMNRATTKRYQDFLWSTPMLGWIGLLIAWKLFDFVFDPVFTAAVNLIYPGVRYG